eukprot:scaffold1197_cov228-Pinguiococcus_pyrenoidosus.AAC.14
MEVALSEAIATALDTPRGKRSRHKPEVFTVEKKSPTPGNPARKKRKQAHKILIAERNKLQATQKKLKSERDELQATQEALESKTDNLQAALEGLKTERAELQTSQRSLQAECEEGLSSQRKLEEQLDIQMKITKKHARWRRRWEVSAFRAKEHAKTEQQAMLEELAQMKRRLAKLTKKLDENGKHLKCNPFDDNEEKKTETSRTLREDGIFTTLGCKLAISSLRARAAIADRIFLPLRAALKCGDERGVTVADVKPIVKVAFDELCQIAKHGFYLFHGGAEEEGEVRRAINSRRRRLGLDNVSHLFSDLEARKGIYEGVEEDAHATVFARVLAKHIALKMELESPDLIDGLDLPPEHQYRKMPPTNDALESLLGRQTLFAEQLVNSKTEIDSAYGIFRSNHFIVEQGEVDLDSTKEPPNVINGMYGLWHKLSLLEKEALADVADRELLQPILERWASRKTQQTENRLLRIDADESLRLRIEMRNRRLLAVVPRIATIQELEERFKEPQSDADRVKWLKHQVRLYRDVYGLDEAKPRSFKVGDKTKVELKEKVASLIRMVTCDPARLQRKEKAAGRRELLKGMTEEMSEYCRKHE